MILARQWQISEDLADERLDRALGSFLPATGLRARRRLLENGRVLLNGHSAKAAQRLRAGDLVELEEEDQDIKQDAPGALLLERQGDYCFFHKPAGLHTAMLAESRAPSLEAALPLLAPEAVYGRPRLLQRLDFGTSGLVAAALSPEAEKAWRDLEKGGKIRKCYLAFLNGRLDKSVRVDLALDTDSRRKSRVLKTRGEKATLLEPLFYWPDTSGLAATFPELKICGEGATLAGCFLNSGQRHQIRAHAAHIGHPLCGDGLYGSGNGSFILEHCGLFAPDCQIRLPEKFSITRGLDPDIRGICTGWLERKKKGK